MPKIVEHEFFRMFEFDPVLDPARGGGFFGPG
jgi:hypothetical protein